MKILLKRAVPAVRKSRKDSILSCEAQTWVMPILEKWTRQLHLPAMIQLRREIGRFLDTIPIDVLGGCSADKAFIMAELIRRFDLKTSLDIGIYRGRSFFPQAMAHRFTHGKVYGIDPYLEGEACENDTDLKDQIAEFAGKLDFNALYQHVEDTIRSSGLQANATLIRKTSMAAVDDIRDLRFWLIHIDGNHDTLRVMEDVDAYAPRLQENGFVVLDDISWPSVRPAYERLARSMSHVFERVDPLNDYAVFWAGHNRVAALLLKAFLTALGKALHE